MKTSFMTIQSISSPDRLSIPECGSEGCRVDVGRRPGPCSLLSSYSWLGGWLPGGLLLCVSKEFRIFNLSKVCNLCQL